MHSGPENLKKSRPKKLVKSNKSISRTCFWSNFIFCHFKNDQKSIFELAKSLKLPKFPLVLESVLKKHTCITAIMIAVHELI